MAVRLAAYACDVDINYLFLRQQIERSRAKAASSNAARKVHEQLAGEYERQIEEVTDGRIMFDWRKTQQTRKQ